MLQHGFGLGQMSVSNGDERLADPGKGILWVQNLCLVKGLISKPRVIIMKIQQAEVCPVHRVLKSFTLSRTPPKSKWRNHVPSGRVQ